MNLSELIQHHTEISEQLIQAIEMDNTELVEQLDKKLSSILDSIIEYRDDSKVVVVEKIAFLLDHVLPPEQRTRMTETICSRIISEVSEVSQ